MRALLIPVTFSAYSPTACSRVSASNILVNPSFEQVTSASSEDGAYLNIPTDAASTYLADSRSGCLCMIVRLQATSLVISPSPVCQLMGSIAFV